MSTKAFKAIAAGLEDAIAYAKGDKSRGSARRVRVKDADVRMCAHEAENVAGGPKAELRALSAA